MKQIIRGDLFNLKCQRTQGKCSLGWVWFGSPFGIICDEFQSYHLIYWVGESEPECIICTCPIICSAPFSLWLWGKGEKEKYSHWPMSQNVKGINVGNEFQITYFFFFLIRKEKNSFLGSPLSFIGEYPNSYCHFRPSIIQSKFL